MLPINWEILAIHKNLRRCVQGGVLGPWIGLKGESRRTWDLIFDSIWQYFDNSRSSERSVSEYSSWRAWRRNFGTFCSGGGVQPIKYRNLSVLRSGPCSPYITMYPVVPLHFDPKRSTFFYRASRTCLCTYMEVECEESRAEKWVFYVFCFIKIGIDMNSTISYN